jgi:hypothetical protein
MQVAAAGKGKIGHRAQFKDVGTGDHEEVGQQFIRCPGGYQRGEVIEDYACIPAAIPDGIVHLAGEEIESWRGVDVDDCKAVQVRQDGRV